MDADAPMTLEEASSTLLRGLVKASTLRAAIAAGTLSHERQGRRIIVTARDIEQWRAACRVEARKAPASGSNPSERPPQARSSAPSGASSTTEDANAALAALRANVEKLRTSSPPTSPRRGRQSASAIVHQLR